jgi:hypothetical protein
MKKKIFISLGLVGIIALSVSIGVYAATAFKVTVNGKATKLDVKVINKVNYVPLNDFAALVGQDVKTDIKTNTITVTPKKLSNNELLALEYITVFVNSDNADAKQKFLETKIDPEVKDIFSMVVALGSADKVVYTNPKVIKSIDYTFSGKKGKLVLIQTDQDEMIVYIRDNKIGYSYLASLKDDVSKKAYNELRSKF